MLLDSPRTFIDVTQSVDSGKFTGVERMVRGMVHVLRSGDAHMVPVAWDPWLRSFCRLRSAEKERLASRKAVGETPTEKPEGPAWKLWVRRRSRPLGRWFRRVSWHPGDLLVLPEPMPDSRLLGLERKEALSRSIAVCHDVIPWEMAQKNNTQVPAWFDRYLRALAKTRRVICISQETETRLRDAWSFVGVKGTATSVVPWPVPFEEERPRHVPPADSRRILCVSSINERKNHSALIDAAKILKEREIPFEIILVGREGKGAGMLVGEIMEARAQGLPVLWRRHISDEELRLEYERCAFTVLPSLMEGFGLPILESLWHHRPCLCHDEGAMLEIAQGGGCLTLDMRNYRELADTITRLFADRAELERLTQEATQRSFRTWADWHREFLAVTQLTV
jgi:glycosyltransferase involved in cell wall biosynthesis